MNEFHPKPFGKYFLIEKLATGGMAEIYKAKIFGVDGFEKLLAIKRILPHCSADKEFINMLVDEAKLSVLLSHTNIVQVYDLGKVGDDYFISMEFINGINMRDVLNRGKELKQNLTEDVVVYIMSETSKGLDYAHSKKDNEGKPLSIVHRDVSPQNILISLEGEVKIVDFGIAKAAMNISHTMAGILKGKISYMSPEQALGKPIDRKTDIFSAGLILYELLTGEKFFTGETQFEVLKKIRTTRINESSFPDTVSLPLRKILAKALSYSTKDRYDNAGDFQIDLTRYLYSTYVDFTPRKLSNLMRQLFAEEIEKKTTAKKEEISIDSKTRSVLIDALNQENLVHRGPTEVTLAAGGKSLSQTSTDFFTGEETSAKTELHEETRAQPILKGVPTPRPVAPVVEKKRAFWKYPLAAVLLLGAVAGLYFKTNLFRAPLPVITGNLQINSTPEGAQLYLNDSETNLLTPATIKSLEVGKPQKITLKKSKFKDWSRTITLVDPNLVTLTPTLEVIPVGMIKVTTTPPGAKIYVDGKDTGKTSPAALDDLPLSQTYSLKLELEKHRPVEERVTLYSIEPINFDKKLEEIQYATIRVASNPSGARVYVNNNDTGLNTPATVPNLEVGKRYVLRLARSGYQDVVRSVDLADRQGVSFTEKLTKIETKTPAQLAQEKAKQEAEKTKTQEEQKPKEQTSQQTVKEPPVQKQETEKEKTKETDKTQATQGSAEETYVALSSNPKGADVFIDGVKRGSAPGKFKVSASKPLGISISKSGLSTITKVVTLRPGETRNLGTIDLGGGGGGGSEAAGIIMVDSNPPGAMVFLNGQPQKATPLRIKGLRPATTHTVMVKKDGYETWSTSFTVGEGAKSFMANLKKL